jgi:hypothetical protein
LTSDLATSESRSASGGTGAGELKPRSGCSYGANGLRVAHGWPAQSPFIVARPTHPREITWRKPTRLEVGVLLFWSALVTFSALQGVTAY